MNRSVSFLLLFWLLTVFSLHASAPAKTAVTYMDPDNQHQVVLYNNSEGKTILVIDRVEYPDGYGTNVDTLLLDNENRIIRTAALFFYDEGQMYQTKPSIIENPESCWNLDDVATKPFFKRTDYETLNSDERRLVGHYENMRNQLLTSYSENIVEKDNKLSLLTWIGFGLILLGLLAAIATLTLKLSTKSLRILGGYVAAIFLWCGLYPVWAYLNMFWEVQFTAYFVILYSILVIVYSNAVMNRLGKDHTLTNKEIKSAFIPATVVSFIVCIFIGYQYAWWASLLGFTLAFNCNYRMWLDLNRCEECKKMGTLKDYDELRIGTKVYETSNVEGSPDVYRVYREVKYDVYVERFRCSACGHIQESSTKNERPVESKFIRKEYLFTEKQRSSSRPSTSSSGAFPKVYRVTLNCEDYVLTQSSKYSETDYVDQYNGRWEKNGSGFNRVERGYR